MSVPPVVPVNTVVHQMLVKTSLVTVAVTRYDDGWHVQGTHHDRVWRSEDDALCVAAALARELHRAAEIEAEASAIRDAAPERAMRGRSRA